MKERAAICRPVFSNFRAVEVNFWHPVRHYWRLLTWVFMIVRYQEPQIQKADRPRYPVALPTAA